ncbi:MAG: chitobiase/beta-hexosaminidase C-terminal domain-containing protein, partial [Peptococcaceae bacterium]|nr:chitobiase/beta-hexosaminidase C-terminal domain-containing protein [Peptococcaceae bacterium]
FDGAGHTISGLVLANSSITNVGLFGVNEGTIKNLNVNVSFDVDGRVGGLVGYNYGTIENCTSAGSVKSGTSYAGGLVGINNDGTISKSGSTVAVTGSGSYAAGGLVGYNYAATASKTALIKYSYAKGSVSGYRAGGLVGYNYGYASSSNAAIENSYAHGNVTGTQYAGGLVGFNDTNSSTGLASVKYCYAVGVISGATKGGLIGYNGGKNEVVSAYYNATTSTCTDNTRGAPLTDENMKLTSSYVGWDFSNDWGLAAGVNSGYPYLKVLNNSFDAVSVSGVSLSDSAKVIQAGNSFTLTATVLPTNATNKMVLWSSGNDAVATVSNGVVTAKSAGTTQIIVTTVDGGYTALCNVTVSAASEPEPEKVAAVTANPGSGAVTSGTTVTLSTTTSGATIRYTTNGSEPTASSTAYATPITITAATTIKAKAFKTGLTDSDTATFNYTVIAITAPTLTVGTVSGHPGDEVSVTVSLANNPGLATFTLNLNFDKSKLQPVSITQGAALTVGSIVSNIQSGLDLTQLDYVSAVWYNTTNTTANGVLYTVKFKIKDGLGDGVTPLTLTVSDASDQIGTDVALSAVNGSVSVVTFIYGDVFEDGAVNGKDVVLLSQYLAGWPVTLTPAQLLAADVFPDGVLNGKDVVRLAQYLAGWPVKLGE